MTVNVNVSDRVFIVRADRTLADVKGRRVRKRGMEKLELWEECSQWPESGCPAGLSFRNKGAAPSAVSLLWNDIWVTDVIRREDSRGGSNYNFKRDFRVGSIEIGAFLNQ